MPDRRAADPGYLPFLAFFSAFFFCLSLMLTFSLLFVFGLSVPLGMLNSGWGGLECIVAPSLSRRRNTFFGNRFAIAFGRPNQQRPAADSRRP